MECAWESHTSLHTLLVRRSWGGRGQTNLKDGRRSMVKVVHTHTLTSQLCLAAALMEVYVAFKSCNWSKPSI